MDFKAALTEEFGRNQVVPAAVLSGVFKAENLAQAQKRRPDDILGL